MTTKPTAQHTPGRSPSKPWFYRYVEGSRDIPRAAGWDAGDRSMKAAGRSRWTRQDYNAAVREFNRLAPIRRFGR
jgi:hypothetical protein